MMLALETMATITDHRLVIQDSALPAHSGRARAIVLWESQALPALLGMGIEHGDIFSRVPVCSAGSHCLAVNPPAPF